MGHVSEGTFLTPTAIEHPLSWGPVIRGLRWGSGDASVLLLHEPGVDLDAWGSLPTTLANHLPISVTACDLPGHGLSDDPWEIDRLPDLLQELCGQDGEAGRRFAIGAGVVAKELLDLAAEIGLAGIVAFSPTTGGQSPSRSPRVPKLLFAGSQADDDLRIARQLATASGGWAVVTAVPVSERGTAMFSTPWKNQITEQNVAFLRDCLHPRQITPKIGRQQPFPPRPARRARGAGG
jgi:pimeloyl-ACP methyl ester carboxylesterase